MNAGGNGSPRPSLLDRRVREITAALPSALFESLAASAAASINRPTVPAERIYDTLYCALGQAENLIKLHKAQLKSDRISCRSANANQMRLILHTAAYWLMGKLGHAMSCDCRAANRRVRHHRAAPDQARRTRHRNRHLHPRGLRQRLPRGGYVPADRSRPLPGADLASAAVPPTPSPVQKLRKPLENPR